MEEAGAPLTATQEPQIKAFYEEDTQQRAQLRREGQGTADPAKLADLEKATLGKVAKVLTPEQRKALLESRTKQ
jgi:Spy/CpxP family protein refolding chaperone